ncbi:hypothetical protein [Nonomuraea sp. NPDC049480]|uniref:hypothetical protein n=1 Tax=Nonomuraea sp. NPDC049480 TaxID=3364353 RepID=UPI003791A47A
MLLEALEAIHGLAVKSGLRHHSNLRRFPKRRNNGVAEITFGHPVGCSDISAFERLLQTLIAG